MFTLVATDRTADRHGDNQGFQRPTRPFRGRPVRGAAGGRANFQAVSSPSVGLDRLSSAARHPHGGGGASSKGPIAHRRACPASAARQWVEIRIDLSSDWRQEQRSSQMQGWAVDYPVDSRRPLGGGASYWFRVAHAAMPENRARGIVANELLIRRRSFSGLLSNTSAKDGCGDETWRQDGLIGLRRLERFGFVPPAAT